MPSYSRSLRAKAAEINGSPVESVPEKSLHSRIVPSSRESGSTILRKATETPPRRPTRANEFIVLFIYIPLKISCSGEKSVEPPQVRRNFRKCRCAIPQGATEKGSTRLTPFERGSADKNARETWPERWLACRGTWRMSLVNRVSYGRKKIRNTRRRDNERRPTYGTVSGYVYHLIFMRLLSQAILHVEKQYKPHYCKSHTSKNRRQN